MHHKRSKMKPEEELPSPGAVSVQVRIVCIFPKTLKYTFIYWLWGDILLLSGIILVGKSQNSPAFFRFLQESHITAGHLPKRRQQQTSLPAPDGIHAPAFGCLLALVSHPALISRCFPKRKTIHRSFAGGVGPERKLFLLLFNQKMFKWLEK